MNVRAIVEVLEKTLSSKIKISASDGTVERCK